MILLFSFLGEAKCTNKKLMTWYQEKHEEIMEAIEILNKKLKLERQCINIGNLVRRIFWDSAIDIY